MRKLVLLVPLAAAAAVAVAVSASASSSPPQAGWALVTQGRQFAPLPAAPAAAQAGAASSFRLVSVADRADFVDTGRPGESPGDVVLLNERLLMGGRQVGRVEIHIQIGVRSTFRTELTAMLTGRGNLEAAGILRPRGDFIVGPLAITGGTGEFRDAGGQLFIGAEPAPGRTPVLVNLLHLR